MGDIDNGFGEPMPDEMTITLWVDNSGNIIKVDAPLGKWPDGAGKWAATAWKEAWFSSEAWVQPNPIKDGNFHTLDQPKQSFTYLDCGRWGGPAALSSKAQRDFGIVWGPWAALCQFVPDASQNTPANYIQANGARADNVINDVIDGLRSANSSVKLIKSLWSTTPANTPAIKGLDWNPIYVILPDMHLPIIDADPVAVTYKLPGGEMQAPYDENRMGRFDYPEVRMEPGKYVLDTNDGAMKIMEWFRRYHAGDIFGGPTGAAAVDLTVFLGLLGKCSLKDRIHFVQVGDMYDLWIGLDCFFDKLDAQTVQIGDRNGIKAGDFIGFWVDRTNKVFPGMMSALGSVAVGQKSWLWGNHDNYLASQGGHTPGTLTGAARIKEIRKGGIYIEHGQRGDSSNRDGETSGQSMTNTVFQYPVVRSFDPNRRDYFTTTAAISYASNPDFCVYAMGHTHSPFLTRVNVMVKRYVPPARTHLP